MMTPAMLGQARYARQTMAQRRKGGGTGRGAQSYWKHDQIKWFLGCQLPILAKSGHGLIIDMHAGDGEPVDHPIADLFAGKSLETTPALAVGFAEKFGADVILCERSRDARKQLEDEFGDRPVVVDILGNNKELIKPGMAEWLQDEYPWIVVINDPNGFGDQSEEVMLGLSVTQRVIDFVIVVNLHSFVRPLGLPEDSKLIQCQRARESANDHAWMQDGDAWLRYLGRKAFRQRDGKLSSAMQARVFLVSNMIPERVR